MQQRAFEVTGTCSWPAAWGNMAQPLQCQRGDHSADVSGVGWVFPQLSGTENSFLTYTFACTSAGFCPHEQLQTQKCKSHLWFLWWNLMENLTISTKKSCEEKKNNNKKNRLWHRNQEIIKKIYCVTTLASLTFTASCHSAFRGVWLTTLTTTTTFWPESPPSNHWPLKPSLQGLRESPLSLPTSYTLLRQPEAHLCLGSSCHWPFPHLSSRGFFANVGAGPLCHHSSISSYVFWSRMALLLPDGSIMKSLKTLLLPPSYTAVRVAVNIFLM